MSDTLGRTMPPKTVASLLAQQPDDVLVEMRDSIESEIARLDVELQLVKQALGRRPRRGGVTAASSGGGTGTRLSGVRREDVLRVAMDLDPPITPRDVRRQFELRGVSLTGAAVRNHLSRLVKDGQLLTSGDGSYWPVGKDSNDKTASDDPLFTASQTRSWETEPASSNS